MHRRARRGQHFGHSGGRPQKTTRARGATVASAAMDEKRNTPAPASATKEGHGTLKLASYQKVERRKDESERRGQPMRAVLGERRTAGQRVLRALFGT